MKTLRNLFADQLLAWLAASLLLTLSGPLWAGDLDLEVIGSWPLLPRGPAQAVAVSGSYAYLVGSSYNGIDYTSGLQVIDISDPPNHGEGVPPRRP